MLTSVILRYDHAAGEPRDELLPIARDTLEVRDGHTLFYLKGKTYTKDRLSVTTVTRASLRGQYYDRTTSYEGTVTQTTGIWGSRKEKHADGSSTSIKFMTEETQVLMKIEKTVVLRDGLRFLEDETELVDLWELTGGEERDA